MALIINSEIHQFARFAARKTTIRKGLMLSLIVGTILNMINQGELIAFLKLDQINYFKLTLTYITPFMVSVYSTATTLMRVGKSDF